MVSRCEHAAWFELRIESRLSQFGKDDSATDCERTTSQLATETLQRDRVASEVQSCIQVLKSGKRRILETGNVNSYIARAAQHRPANCSFYIDIQSDFPIQLLYGRHELSKEVYRAARQAGLRCNWRFVGQFSGSYNFLYVEVLGLKCHKHFAVGRNDRRTCTKISPHEWD